MGFLAWSYSVQSFTLTICYMFSGPGGGSLHALALAVTCMEQLNTQKLSANQGKPMKAFSYFCSYSLMHRFLSCLVLHVETVLCFLWLFQLNPPVNLTHDWEGTTSPWRGRSGEDGKEMDAPLVSLLFPALSVYLLSWSLKCLSRPPLPLCKVLWVYASPPTWKRGRKYRQVRDASFRQLQSSWLDRRVSVQQIQQIAVRAV